MEDMAEIKTYSDDELEFAENQLKILSNVLDDGNVKAIQIAIWCIEKERYNNMDDHWKITSQIAKGKEINMDENKIKLLKFALKMGEVALESVYAVADYCENLSNAYYDMKEELAKILGVDYEDLSD